jgi:hypothetical protein
LVLLKLVPKRLDSLVTNRGTEQETLTDGDLIEVVNGHTARMKMLKVEPEMGISQKD